MGAPLRSQRTARRLASVAIGALVWLGGQVAANEPTAVLPASTADGMNRAVALVERAQTLTDRSRGSEALVLWQSAYDLSRDPTLLLEVARLERQQGRAARATRAFEVYLAQGGDRVPARQGLVARRQMQEAAAVTARLHIRTNVLGAAVELEPERGVAAVDGFVLDLLLDAGERRVAFSKPGYETQSLVLTLEPGESRTLRVDLDKAVDDRSESGSSRPRFALASSVARADG